MKIGIIGLGDGGWRHAQAISSIDDLHLHGLCDISKKRLQGILDNQLDNPRVWPQFQEKESIIATTSPDILIRNNDIELIIVATPDHLHYEPTLLSLKSGKHVFIEKPIATTIPDLDKFQDLAIAYPNKMHYSESYSYSSIISVTLKYFRSGELGELIWGSCEFTMPYSDRIMNNAGWRLNQPYNPCAGAMTHHFPIMLLFARSMITSVQALGRVISYNKLKETNGFDHMQGHIRLGEDGPVVSWIACMGLKGAYNIYQHRPITFHLQFDNGYLSYNSKPEHDVLNVAGKEVNFQNEPEVINPIDPTEWLRYRNNHFVSMLKDIHQAILNPSGHKPLHSIYHGINVAKASILAFESASQYNGNWVTM